MTAIPTTLHMHLASDAVGRMLRRRAKVGAAALKAGFSPATAAFCFVPPDYYERSLDERAVLLSAPSVDLLCKTIVVENRKRQEAAALCALVPSRPDLSFALISVFFLRGVQGAWGCGDDGGAVSVSRGGSAGKRGRL